jgi:hypothetical protein
VTAQTALISTKRRGLMTELVVWITFRLSMP